MKLGKVEGKNERMNAALGHKPATAPSVVVDTIANSESHQNVHDDDDVDEDESLFTAHNEHTSTTTLLSDTIELESTTESTEEQSKPQKKSKKKKKRGKSSNSRWLWMDW